MGKTYGLILKRRTIRRFKQDVISDDILKKFVNAARVAPSAANLQPLEYIIVSDKDLVDEVFTTLAWAGYIAPSGNPREGERPVSYIVVLLNKNLAKDDVSSKHDSGASIENMILSALEEGIGSCWIGSINKNKLRRILNIPEHLEIDSILALGYPNEEPIMVEMRDSIRYWKDESGRLNVPKRKLSDILHWNNCDSDSRPNDRP